MSVIKSFIGDAMPPPSVTLYSDGSGYFDLPGQFVSGGSLGLPPQKAKRLSTEISELVGSVRWDLVSVGNPCYGERGDKVWVERLRLSFCHMRIDDV